MEYNIFQNSREIERKWKKEKNFYFLFSLLSFINLESPLISFHLLPSNNIQTYIYVQPMWKLQTSSDALLKKKKKEVKYNNFSMFQVYKYHTQINRWSCNPISSCNSFLSFNSDFNTMYKLLPQFNNLTSHVSISEPTNFFSEAVFAGGLLSLHHECFIFVSFQF